VGTKAYSGFHSYDCQLVNPPQLSMHGQMR
jgi:hypothetical protein